MLQLPDRPINIIELDKARRKAAKELGIRNDRLTKSQKLQAVIQHNSQFAINRGWPFPIDNKPDVVKRAP